LKNQNIIIFSSIDWTTHWQIHHQLTTSLIESDNRVLFIENIGVRAPSIKDLHRVKSRITSRFNSTHGFKNEEVKLTINSPIFIPFPYNKFATYLNSLIISRSIRNWSSNARFDNFIVISFLPTPTIQKIISIISPMLSIYYCADDMGRTLKNPSKLEFFEKKMFQSSDYVFTTSNKKYKQAKTFNINVAYIPAGVSIKNFTYSENISRLPDTIQSINTPIIGYIGAISDVFDKKLIITIANFFSEATILLVGPIYTDISELQACSNIILTKEVAYNEISKYVQNFDVALIPYIVNEFTNCVYPCKLNEYLAMGIPVVSSNLDEIALFEREYRESIIIAKDSGEFIKSINKILLDKNSKSTEESLKRVEIAKENTWDARFQNIDRLLDQCAFDKSQLEVNWEEHLNKFFKEKWSNRFKKIITITLLYIVIFQSPLAWYFGEQLVIRDFPVKSDAIVIFTGNGEASYRNTSYQRRALDGVKLYKGGYAEKIYLSSGIDQTIPEVKFVKLFLHSQGIPKESIHILDRYPHSTFENVMMVKEMLDKDGIKSIIFITSPYHSLRASLTWKKNAKDINIVSPAVVDTPSPKLKWGIGLDKMKIIAYEYLAIINNWFKGSI
jgi:uncharacterized SAM-binding protein YcdF (DUF218 family)/glycosyltransferase involved in cell wall biosynthesis